ncbi:MAG: uroporphyrinogen decarboxylase family protein [Kiritimatiellae bacterium]|nr:uroporphyrinogen decarboxylase family protein [Kiritimatiellia bacterium]
MNSRQRFLDVLNGRRPADRLPMIEWAAWWNLTVERWEREGLHTAGRTYLDLQEDFGLDPMTFLPAAPTLPEFLHPAEGEPAIKNEQDYERARPYLFSDEIIGKAKASAMEMRARQARGEIVVRMWLDGFFWFPRKLLGIEPHLYAFYDQPALMRRMNDDLAEFSIRAIEAIFPVVVPDMVGFAEDMSYNNGPMLSEAQFMEFLAPYYRRVIPHLKQAGVRVLTDSDGDIALMVPWLLSVGIEGIYPLERQAGVDLVDLRRKYPEFIFMGGYDKMVMSRGEAAMRAEFERLLPVMRSGRYVPSVDHQTPPGVSLENYRTYLRLFNEYASKAVS